MRTLIFGLVLVASAVSIVTGCALWWPPAAFMAAGLLGPPIAWLILGETPDAKEG